MMRRATLQSVAFYAPPRVETNAALSAEHPDWAVEKLAGRTGIEQRHIADQDLCASDLAYEAAKLLLDKTSISAEEIDYLILCTQTPDYFLPTTACLLQARLGLSTQTAAFDINQGCSGYVYGLVLSKALIESGLARNVLFLTADTYSKLIHPLDRTTRVLFGDGASASLITESGKGATLGHARLGTDGSGADKLMVPAGAFRERPSEATRRDTADSLGCTRNRESLYMDGAEISSFVMSQVPRLVRSTVDGAGLRLEDIDWFIFHQANAFLQQRLCALLKIPAERAPLALQKFGNTVSSTIPMCLASHARRIRPQERVLLTGFGVGLSWGSMLLEWGEVDAFVSGED